MSAIVIVRNVDQLRKAVVYLRPTGGIIQIIGDVDMYDNGLNALWVKGDLMTVDSWEKTTVKLIADPPERTDDEHSPVE